MPLEGGSFEGFAETGSEPNAKRARFAKSEGAPGSANASEPSEPPTKRAVLPLLRRLISDLNRRILQSPQELLSFEELEDFAEATTPSEDEPAKIAQLRKQLTTALHQYFRSRWPTAKSDWTAEEMARGLDRPTGNRSLGAFAVDLSAVGVPYINAAKVPGVAADAISYLVTQHPLPATVGHFWRMVLHLRPTVIVMLNGHVTSDAAQDGFALAPYWEPTAVEGFSLAVEEVRYDSASECSVRMLRCKHGDEVWSGPQIVVPWWRDQSEPPLGSFLQLDRLVDSFLTSGTSQCVLVHCAGGIGRAGVFVAADAGGRAAIRGEARCCSPDRLIGHLRQCRMNMVQTAEQYEFLHRALPLLTKQMRDAR